MCMVVSDPAHDFLGCRDMLAASLPHLTWREDVPPILSFYSFAIASKPIIDLP